MYQEMKSTGTDRLPAPHIRPFVLKRTYGSIITAMLYINKPAEADHLLERCEKHGIVLPSLYAKFVTNALNNRDVDRAAMYMGKKRAYALETHHPLYLPTADNYANLASLLAAHRDPSTLQILLSLYHSFARDKQTYHTWRAEAKKEAETGDHRRDLTDYQIRDAGYEFSHVQQILYHHVLKALRSVNYENGKSTLENALSIVADMRSNHVLRSTITYNHLLLISSKDKKYHEMNVILDMMLAEDRLKADKETLSRVKFGYNRTEPDPLHWRAIHRVTDSINAQLPAAARVTSKHERRQGNEMAQSLLHNYAKQGQGQGQKQEQNANSHANAKA
jgi:hypothetical protein